MSELKFENNLFLGKRELDHFKESLGEGGYRKLSKQIFNSYGVAKPSNALGALKVIAGTLNGQLSIQSGVAVDSDINTINVESNLIDELTIPADSTKYYIIIEYTPTPTQEGTVSISTTGQVTGVGTKFTEVLRSLPNFPSVITFNASANTQEYVVASIVDDLNLNLNVASGVLTAEAGKTYDIVGTFTPGVSVPTLSKYPIVRDGYTISTSTSSAVTSGTQFLLGSAINDGASTVIEDLREINVLTLFNNLISDDLITGHPFITLTEASFDEISTANNLEGDGSENYYKFEWGFFSTSGNWSYTSGTKTLNIVTGSGGSWGAASDFVDGSFNGWYVYFSATGQKVGIVGSLKDGATINAILETDIPLTGDIVIIPPGNTIEIVGKSIYTLTSDDVASKVFSIASGGGVIKFPAGDSIYARYRWIGENKTTSLEEFNNTTYTNEEGNPEPLAASLISTIVRAALRANWGASWITGVVPSVEYTGLSGTPAATSTTFKYKIMGKTVFGSIRCNLDTALTPASHGYTTIKIFDLPFSVVNDLLYLNSNGVCADVNDGLACIAFPSLGTPNNEIHVRLTDYTLGAPKEFQDNLKTLIMSFTAELV